MDTIETLNKQLELYQAELEKHKRGMKKSIPFILGIVVIFPIVPLPSRHHTGIHSMIESLHMNYPLCVAMLGSVFTFALLRHTRKERKRLKREINFTQQKLDKFKVSE